MSRNEYERYFAAYPDVVRVLRDGPLMELSMEGGACPHFDEQCTAYEGRPVECQLFPHTNHRVQRVGPFLFVTYHHRTVCPIRSQILASDREARELISRLLRDAYGPQYRLVLLNENAPTFRWLRRLYFRLTGRGEEWRGPVSESDLPRAAGI